MSFEEALLRIRHRRFRSVDILYGSDDQKEGARAFAEKRRRCGRGDKRRLYSPASGTSGVPSIMRE
jgi:hypothetical protein